MGLCPEIHSQTWAFDCVIKKRYEQLGKASSENHLGCGFPGQMLGVQGSF